MTEFVLTQERQVVQIFKTVPTFAVIQKDNTELILLGKSLEHSEYKRASDPNQYRVVAVEKRASEVPTADIIYCESYKGITEDIATELGQRIAKRYPDLEVVILKSTNKRIKGNIIWKTETLLQFANVQFIDERTEELPEDGLFIPNELANRIVAGDEKYIIKANELDIPVDGREFVLASDMAHGLISITDGIEVDLDTFRTLAKSVTEDLRKKFFPRKKRLYLYKIENFIPFDEPRSYYVPDEIEDIVEDFEIIERQERDSLVIQTLIFPKDKFETSTEAKAWAKEHGFKSSKVDETESSFRLRQKDPGKFKRLRTFTLGDGVKAVGGPLKTAKAKEGEPKSKGEYNDKKKKPVKKFLDGSPMVEGFGEEGGVHAHALRRNGGVTAEDGAHKHLFIIPAGTELSDGTVLERDTEAITMESGAHWHSVNEDGVTGEESSKHSHLLILADGATIETSVDGEHSHEQLVSTTAFDGLHAHTVQLPNGVTLKSLTPEEFAEMHPGVGSGRKPIHSASEVLLVSKSEEADIPEAETREVEYGIGKIYKADTEERMVLGVVMEPDEVDTQGDTQSEDEITKTMERFMEEFQNFKIMHKGKKINNAVKILENYQAPVDFEMNGKAIKKGTWLLKLRILSDDLWQDIKGGLFTGFSIGGHAKVAAV